MVTINSNSTSSMEAWMLVVRSVSVVTWIGRRKVRLQLRQDLLDGFDHRDRVRAGLPLDVENDGRRFVHPRRLTVVLDAVDDVGDISYETGALLR